MKHILITLCVLFSVILSNAQEHLSFKGIPIEGDISSFCRKLKSKGFTQILSENDIRLFTGDFTGREATIGVISDQSGKNVFSVAVLFNASGEWKNLVNTYDYYKELYTEKYGAPSFSREYNPSVSNDNIALMAEVHNQTIVYGSIFNAPGGTIVLAIDKAEGVYQGRVIIRYKDAENVNVKRQSDLDEI